MVGDAVAGGSTGWGQEVGEGVGKREEAGKGRVDTKIVRYSDDRIVG